MSATAKKSADEQILTYKGHPLMRHNNIIYYGSMSDRYIIMMQILETKKVKDMEVATKDCQFSCSRHPQAWRPKDRIVKKTEKNGLYTALDIAVVWLNRALSAK